MVMPTRRNQEACWSRLERPVAFLYVIMEGELEVVSPENKSIATLAAGDIIGEMSLIEKRLPEVSVRAGEQARVLAVPLERVRNKLESDQSFAARFYRALAVLLSDRLRSANRKLKTSDTPGNSQDRATQSYDPSELDEGIMDNLHVAGDRMRRLLALLEGRKV